MKVSVVIPVYNAGKYLHRCIGSLLAQTIACEFIFVNDGSNDNSKSIIESYKRSDGRIVLLEQENQGVSVARNTGIKAAKGEYLGFVDADDYIENDMYLQLYSAANSFQADIVISDFYYEQGKSKNLATFGFPKETTLTPTFIAENIFPFFIKDETLNSACNKIFRREFIVQNQIDFPEKVALGEDSIFNMKAFSRCERACYLGYAGYHYQEVAGSATRNVAESDYFKRIADALRFDYRSVMPLKLDGQTYEKLKAEKFISSLLSLVHLYFNAKGIGLFQKFRLVKTMIESPETVRTIALHYDELRRPRNRYSRFLLQCIKNQDIYRLFLAVLYSKLRNR